MPIVQIKHGFILVFHPDLLHADPVFLTWSAQFDPCDLGLTPFGVYLGSYLDHLSVHFALSFLIVILTVYSLLTNLSTIIFTLFHKSVVSNDHHQFLNMAPIGGYQVVSIVEHTPIGVVVDPV